MSNRILILMFVAILVPGLSALAAEDDQVDPKLAERAQLIVRAQRLPNSRGRRFREHGIGDCERAARKVASRCDSRELTDSAFSQVRVGAKSR